MTTTKDLAEALRAAQSALSEYYVQSAPLMIQIDSALASHDAAQSAGEAPVPVAWLHTVVQNEDGEEDMAPSFAPDNFPLMGEAPGFFQSIKHEALYTHPAALPSPSVGRDELEDVIAKWESALVNAERRAITFADIMERHCIAMQAAVIEGHLTSHASGLQWIVNTLSGPGLLPDLEDAKEMGGAQAWFDAKVAENEAFRAAHPGPKESARAALEGEKP